MTQSLKVLDDSLAEAQRLGALWIHAGDMVHTTGHALNYVSSSIIHVMNDYPDVVKVGVWGNHDSRTRGAEITFEETYQYTLAKSVPSFFVLNGETLEWNGLTVWGIGAQPNDSMELWGVGHADIGILHGQVEGSQLSSSGIRVEEGLSPKKLRELFTFSIVGDIHIPHPSVDILIPGSPEAHNFGDVGERCWWVVDWDKGPAGLRPMVSGSPLFVTVETAAEVKDDNNFYRVMSGGGGDVPANATVVRPAPQVDTKERGIRSRDGTHAILKSYMDLFPPPEGEGYFKAGVELLGDYEPRTPRRAEIVSVTLHNFLSYEDEQLTIMPGINLVLGESAEYTSNGAGKSSIFEAIFWALTGRTTKGCDADDVIQWGKKKCWVELEIAVDDSTSQLVIKRSRNPKPTLEAHFNGDAIEGKSVADVTNAVETLLGISSESYRALSYFSQEDTVLLARETDAGVKKIVGGLIGLEAYAEASARAGDLHRVLEQPTVERRVQLTVYEDRVEELDTEIESLEADRLAWQVEQRAAREKLVGDSAVLGDHLIDVVQAGVERLRSLDNRIIVRAVEHHSDQRDKVRGREYMAGLVKIEETVRATKAGLEKPADPINTRIVAQSIIQAQAEEQTRLSLEFRVIMEKAQESTEELATVDALLREIERKLSSSEEDLCHACNQPIKDAHILIHELTLEQQNLVEDRSTLVVERERFGFQREAIVAAKEKSGVIIEAANKCLTANDQVDAYNQSLAYIAEMESAAQETADRHAAELSETSFLKGTDKDANQRTEVAYWIKERGKAAEQEVQLKMQEIDDLDGEAFLYDARLDVLRRERKKNHGDAVTAASDIAENVELLELYAYWKKAFGKGGIQGLLIDEVGGYFNMMRSEVFPTLTGGVYDVQFSSTSQTKTGEDREKVEFMVLKRGVPVPYAGLSGGQRRRVDLGVLLTMTLAVSEIYQIPGLLGIVILDEVFSFLDDNGSEALAETLAILSEKIPSIYLVSQDTAMQSLFDQSITVVQDKTGTSRVT